MTDLTLALTAYDYSESQTTCVYYGHL